jgi:hypothetical protein
MIGEQEEDDPFGLDNDEEVLYCAILECTHPVQKRTRIVLYNILYSCRAHTVPYCITLYSYTAPY